MATFKQINFIKSLAIQKGYASAREAAVAYGFDATVSFEYMPAYDVSGLIDWLGGTIKTVDVSIDIKATEADKAAYAEKVTAIKTAVSDKSSRVDAIMIERWLNHLTGQARRDARYAIGKEI